MKCPNDNAVLQMTSRSGVTIDYCPECRGVWLDRNELDKIIETESSVRDYSHKLSESDFSRYQGEDDGSRHHKKKRESFLGELFDF